ncbi:MAG: extracellular solute-binding protein, partial [Bacillota bacterium]
GLIPKNSITEGHGKAIDMYQAGEIAILPSGPQFLKIVKENAPKIAEVTASGPQITGDSGKMNVAVMNLVVPKQSKHQKEAVDFALFITNAENQLKFCKLTAILPSVKKAAEDPYFTKLPDNAEPIDEARIISASQLPKSEVLVPPLKGYDDLKKAMNEAMQSALLGKKSVDKALADAEKKWNEILAKP